MLDLSRVKTKEKITIIQQDKYPDTPVLTVLPNGEGKSPSIQLNRKAMDLMNVSDDANRLIMFPEYNISQTEEVEYDSVIGVVKDARVDGPKKKHNSYQIHLATRRVKSKYIHGLICDLFNVSDTEEHEFEINNVDGLQGAFTLSEMTTTVDSETTVEVEFDKGETLVIEQE